MIGVGLVLGVGLLRKWRSFEFPTKPLSQEEKDVVRTLVALILPRDDLSPGAIDLGVDAEVLDALHENRHFRQVVRRGVRWLDDQAASSGGSRFLSLVEGDQIALLERAEVADFGTAENDLFRRMCDLTFTHYYSKPKAWAGLCYRGPPQPSGYLDYQSPPEECGTGG